MTKSHDEAKTSHTPESQPSVHPGSDEPQTITAPTPPVAWTGDAPDPADLADEEEASERSRTPEEPKEKPETD
ncbi:hypothetical protein [Streptomyces neyagawaensis]|uniref:hypothetical protein n=1 Tax=Streptomyces neyagawaensis TaxID=42238 RepID=UPI0006E2CF03|nr:hypothetical protein [Streptomyces neyagawaensis]MCL6734798.1 hypothetical protein [Streptomyces neyagawaensis]MDE1686536.1 hypothetical protein [Streptomyces neyagawaensis]